MIVIDCDIAALESIKYLDYNQNVVYYIEHLEAGTWIMELITDYCKADTLKNCEQPTIIEHQMLQIKYNVEQVAPDEVVIENETVEDDHEPTKANRGF